MRGSWTGGSPSRWSCPGASVASSGFPRSANALVSRSFRWLSALRRSAAWRSYDLAASPFSDSTRLIFCKRPLVVAAGVEVLDLVDGRRRIRLRRRSAARATAGAPEDGRSRRGSRPLRREVQRRVTWHLRGWLRQHQSISPAEVARRQEWLRRRTKPVRTLELRCVLLLPLPQQLERLQRRQPLQARPRQRLEQLRSSW